MRSNIPLHPIRRSRSRASAQVQRTSAMSKLSIRAKIISVVAFLLLTMAGVGLLAVRNMRAINASTVDIVTNWMPSVRVLGELRAGVITYRNVIREHILAETAEEKQATEKTLAAVVAEN